jgi:hypothetical protein
VLGTDHADIPFVAAAPYRHYLAAEGSPESLADRLLALCADSDRWQEFAIAAREHVIVQHGTNNFRRLEQLYDLVGAGETE